MKVTILIACIVFLTACIQQEEKQPPPYQNTMHLSPAYLASLDTVNYTVIQWLDSTKNFGTVKEGDSIKFDYRFKNIGDKPLLLSKVQTSCGCTVTSFPQNAIFPGKESAISVTFNSVGHPGDIFKNISIIANTSNGVKHFVEFRGKVIK